MTRALTYCDYNAGAPVRAEAAVALSRALALGGNASSVHGAGRQMRALIEDAREKLAAATDARSENIVFTSGATEALHLAMATAGAASIIVSAVEHDSVLEHASRSDKFFGAAPVDATGVIDIDALDAMLAKAPRPALVAVQFANNETGVIQPIAKVAARAREYGALLLVDAAQALVRAPLSIANLDATYLVVSSHKMGGPPGAGALILAAGAPFVTSRFGGGQERGRRPGTENGPAIAGFGVAIEIGERVLDVEIERLSSFRRRFEAALPGDAVIFGKGAKRLCNTSNFALRGINAETAVIAMDLAGVAVSSGAACSSGKVRSSRVLAAMGISHAVASGALRVSFGWASKDADVDAVVTALNALAAFRERAGVA